MKNKEGVGMEGEATCPLPIQNSFLNPFDTTQLCCGELHFSALVLPWIDASKLFIYAISGSVLI